MSAPRGIARFALALVAAIGIASPARAQTMPADPKIAPLSVAPDPNNVNVTTGLTTPQLPVLSVPAAPNLRFDRVQNAAPYMTGKVTSMIEGYPTRRYSVHTGGDASDSFTCPDSGDCESTTGTGSTFVPISNFYRQAGSGARWTYNIQHYVRTVPLGQGNGATESSMMYYASSVQYPNGETLTYSYESATMANEFIPGRVFRRPTRISSNLGFHIDIAYAPGAVGEAGWNTVAEAILYAGADTDTTTPLGRLSYSQSGSTLTITDHGDRPLTDNGGRVYTCACSNALGANIEVVVASTQLPGETTPAVESAAAPTAYLVGTVTHDGVPWTYSYANVQTSSSLANGYQFSAVTVEGPNSYHQVYNIATSDLEHMQSVTSVTDSLNRTTSYLYDEAHRPWQITYPEGNQVIVLYDGFSNIVSRTRRAKPGTGLADIVETASFPTDTCLANGTPVLCYRSSWTRDALNRQTDYTWNTTTGQVTLMAEPADANGVRRRTYVDYTTTAGAPARPSVIRVCGDTTTCGGAHELVTEFDYLGNTRLVSAQRRRDGVGGSYLETTFSYDSAGRLLVADGPLAGSDDATYNRYDVYGRKTWEIGPLGANGVRGARRFTYRDSDDKPVLVENGTVPDANSNVLTVISQTATIYDSRRNPVVEATTGSSAATLVQRTFDNSNRLDCEARRMNPAIFASLPASACTLSNQGGDGPDRITHNVYDNAGQLLQIQRAYQITTANGFPATLQQNYVTYTYSPNGKQTSVIDANNNLATMTFDGHDRQIRWTFPSPTTPGVASATDYEAYTYDAAVNRLTLRRRDGLTLGFSYDNLNRLLVKTVPERAGLDPTHTRDVYYGYDLRNAQLFARFDSVNGDGVTNVYDAFGRLTSSALLMDGVSRSVGSVYDPGSRRTQVIQPDGQYFTYTYDGASRLTGLYQGADTSVMLDTFTYNAQGLPATRTERYGSSVTYGFDGVGRLASQGDVLLGAGGNVSRTFGYSPASQMTSRTRDNDAYAWTGGYTVSRNYSVNGLNQYTAAGTASFTYDANGNLTSDGSRTFTYDEENRLVGASGGVTLRYDPLGRLYEVVSTSGTRRFVWDGDAIVNEYGGAGTMTDRFVHGPNAGADDPLVWYDSNGSINWLHADHQGSITGVTNGVTGTRINAYDEWGIPNATNAGPFQYTGQLWLPEIGMYHYKARVYSPTLGRFLQTDPVGYADQFNLYEYVGDDPVNNADPDGQQIGWRHDPFESDEERDRKVQFNESASNGLRNAEIEAHNLLADVLSVFIPVERAVGAGTLLVRAFEGRAVRAAAEAGRDTLRPGPFAGRGIPARGPERNLTAAERRANNGEMAEHGCHTCGTRDPGTRSGDAIPDHQPPNALNPTGGRQRLYPHCSTCSRRQAGQVTQEVMRRRRLREAGE